MNQIFKKIKNVNHYVTPDDFYNKVNTNIQLLTKENTDLFLGTIDIDHFNYINDLLGFEIGDKILQGVAEYFSSILNESGFFTKIHADIFAFCISNLKTKDATKVFLDFINCGTSVEHLLPSGYKLSTSCGIIAVQTSSSSISSILDKTNYARLQAKKSPYSEFKLYDTKMDKELQWQKKVTLSMEPALKNKEFEMYLQPKIAIKNNEVAGGEALVRWNHPKYGLIPPNTFIPIMEQSGFIQKLDFFMLEEACQFLKDCSKKGIPQIPISVNFSKAHLDNSHLVEQIFQTVNAVGINTNMIEIEFTESIFIEGFDRLVEIVKDLKLLGFHVSLDDFGSAYSSLNCLKELPIDIIKIDKGFLQESTNSEKGKLIIAKVVELIKSLRMISIMEGVETHDQVDFLRKLSCDFIQGYYYAKPLQQEAYIEYLKNNETLPEPQDYPNKQLDINDKSYLYTIPEEFQMDNWELYTLGKNIDMGLMKGYLDGEATVQYVNDRALEYLGYTRQEFREIFHNSILAFTHPDDAHMVQKNTEQLISNGKPLEFQTRAIRKDGKVIILKGRSSCVIDNQGRPVGLYAFQDVTDEIEQVTALQKRLTDKITELEHAIALEREARESLHLSQERYRAIVEQSEDIMFDWDFTSDTITFSDNHKHLFKDDREYQDPRNNPSIFKRIHPDHLAIFKEWLQNMYQKVGNHKIEFQCLDGNDNYIWLRVHSTAITDANGQILRAVGLLSNIDAQKSELATLAYKSQRDSLTAALNRGELILQIQSLLDTSPTIPGALFMIDIDNFKVLNDNLGHQLGDAILIELTTKIMESFPENSIVGRMGGDEFAAFIQGAELEDACKYATSLIHELHVSSCNQIQQLNVRVSIGISLYPSCGKTFDELYYRADVALYESKGNGKDCYTVYKDGMSCTLTNTTFIE